MRSFPVLGCLAVFSFGCVRAAPSAWRPEVKTRLDALLEAGGAGGVAAFDWDNTVMKNDIGDATLFWMLRNDRVLQPPGRDWAQTSKSLSPAAIAALNAGCDGAGEPGQPLTTRKTVACADAIFSIYDEGKTPGGEPAWSPHLTATNNAAYAWTAQLCAGHTHEEVKGFARAAYAQDSAAAQGTTQAIGTHAAVTAWVRIYPEMHALIGSLQRRGFAVWVVSASPQAFAEVVAAEVGIGVDHVIGVRMVAGADGKQTYRVQGCGPVADGDDTLITFNEGKRCWINKVIFAAPKDEQLTRLALPRRAAFAAGDSDTDVAFVKDAAVKLVINRNKPELMCNAHHNHGGSWLIQPMFIEPKPAHATPYACGAYRDEEGGPIADQHE